MVPVCLSQAEFEAILSDPSKRIVANIRWSEDEDHSPHVVEFRAEVESDPGYPLFIRGSFNVEAEKLTFALIHRSAGRIYALDMGAEHRNPDGSLVGEKHKHRWTERFRDRDAYVPEDITASAVDPVTVWEQFCMEASIEHQGTMSSPCPRQGELFP